MSAKPRPHSGPNVSRADRISRKVEITLPPEDLERLESLADDLGTSRSDVVRQAVKRMYVEVVRK